MFIPRLVRNILLDEAITLNGTEGIYLNPIYIGDVVAALMKALALKGHHLINIGGPQVLSLREICMMIGERLKRQPIFKHIEPGDGHVVADVSKMKEMLGFPQVAFPEGVVEVCREVERISSEEVTQEIK